MPTPTVTGVPVPPAQPESPVAPAQPAPPGVTTVTVPVGTTSGSGIDIDGICWTDPIAPRPISKQPLSPRARATRVASHTPTHTGRRSRKARKARA